MKKCKQCGVIKSQDQYRPYYGGRTGSYNTCKDCESINSRVKYLKRKSDLSPAEASELSKIYELWGAQRLLGLKPPGVRRTALELVESMLNVNPVNTELQEWLDCELSEDPDYYLDEVYDKLMSKYRPLLSINPETMERNYDDTYKDILDQIQARFEAYEVSYYQEV